MPPPDGPAGRDCLDRYRAELADRFEGGFDAAQNPISEEEMRPPQGLLLVAWLDGEPVGCGALRVVDAGTTEIKRMWTAPAARGLGIARRVLQALEGEAAKAGRMTVRLDTNRSLREAQRFYEQEGYQEVAPFNDQPYADFWYAKRLQAG